jgi:hypothetical protein
MTSKHASVVSGVSHLDNYSTNASPDDLSPSDGTVAHLQGEGDLSNQQKMRTVQQLTDDLLSVTTSNIAIHDKQTNSSNASQPSASVVKSPAAKHRDQTKDELPPGDVTASTSTITIDEARCNGDVKRLTVYEGRLMSSTERLRQLHDDAHTMFDAISGETKQPSVSMEINCALSI